jgi:hypothetical protein
VKGVFHAAAFVAVGSTVYLSYEFLFKPIDLVPLIKLQASNYFQTVLSQQVISQQQDDGGFHYSQAGSSDDTQVWTTAQCLTALLQQDIALVKGQTPAIRRAFDYIERLRLKSHDGGWGYQKTFEWGVTDIDAWVALAYVYSLRGDNAVLVWKPEELSDVVATTNSILELLLQRQHDDGSWSVIEKTSNPKHVRTYSTIMAIWALAEAEQNGDLLKGHEEKYRAALVPGAKWLLASYTMGKFGYSGWWPNPSAKNPDRRYPGLSAHALFALSEAKATHAFIGADPRYKEAIETFIKFAIEGNTAFEPLTKKKVDEETAPGSDTFLDGRPETAQQLTFLWYPWNITTAVALEHDPLLREDQHERLRYLLSMLLRRNDDVNNFVRNNEVIFPTAEVLFADGYYLSRDGLVVK